MEAKKILVISNNPLNRSDGNGRTLLNMMGNFNSSEMLNLFFNSSAKCSFEICEYYQISKKGCLKSKLVKNAVNCKKISNLDSLSSKPSKRNNKIRKTALSSILREKLYYSKNSMNSIYETIKDKGVDAILIQAGDFCFPLELGMYLCDKLSIPMMIFNSEDYCFKDWDYFRSKNKHSFFSRLFQKMLMSTYRKAVYFSDSNIYLTDDLREFYLEHFPNHSAKTIYNCSNLSLNLTCKDFKENLFVYSGNVGVGRIDSLIQIANTLNSINPKYKLSIASLCVDKKLIDKLTGCSNVVYLGSLSYLDNLKLLSEARIIFHAESFTTFYTRDTRFAFSSKIADSLSFLKPFIVFAPSTSSSYSYVNKYRCGYASSSIESLKESIMDALNSNSYRFFDASADAFNKRHSSKTNSSIFMNEYIRVKNNPNVQILISTYKKSKEEILLLGSRLGVSSNCIIRNQCGSNQNISYISNEIKLIESNDSGLSVNRNGLLSSATGKYIVFLDDDVTLYSNYEAKILDAFTRFPGLCALEFNMDRSDGHIHEELPFKYKKHSYIKTTSYGMNGVCFRRSYLVSNNLMFDVRFGSGTNLYCGEDSIFRQLFNKKKPYFLSSNQYLGEIDTAKESSWFKGRDEKYFSVRSKVYGYMHPTLYALYILRMAIKNKGNKDFHLKACMANGKAGKQMRN